jgi:hypothetical protein
MHTPGTGSLSFPVPGCANLRDVVTHLPITHA